MRREKLLTVLLIITSIMIGFIIGKLIQVVLIEAGWIKQVWVIQR